MNVLAKNPRETRIESARELPKAQDISGYEIFSHGDTGAAHALAHHLLDAGQIGTGRRLLGKWLDGRSGHGSDWVHLHFHMAIFELALGDWHRAHARFLAEVLPTAATTADALTDAPALLWRLAMTAPAGIALPWQALRQTVLANLQQCDKPFVQLHNLLALAGAGDSASIERWLQGGCGAPQLTEERPVVLFAEALAALAAGSWQRASRMLRAIQPDVSRVGGSHAQNQLFEQLALWSARQAEGAMTRRAA